MEIREELTARMKAEEKTEDKIEYTEGKMTLAVESVQEQLYQFQNSSKHTYPDSLSD